MKFFVSYSRSIQESVRGIIDALRDSHFDVWWDQDLRVGQDWWSSILDQIEICNVFIFIVSARSVQSPYCMAELRYAIARNRVVLPYMVDDGLNYTIPNELSRIQHEYYKQNPTHFVHRLHVTCQDINWIQYKDRYAPRPSEPNASSDDVVDQLDKALVMAGEGYFEEATQIFNSVLHCAHKEYGTFCNAWIEKIHLYREIAKLARRPTMKDLAFPKWEAFIQQYGEEFDPLDLRSLFLPCDSPITHPTRPSSPWDAKSSVKFDVYDAIIQFQAACDEQEWETAQSILQLIRTSGVRVPVVFDIDANERELQRCLDNEERDKNYHLIRCMLKMKSPNYQLIYEALQIFCAKYPGYDPDGLTESRDLFARIWLASAEASDEDDHASRLQAYSEALRLKPDFVEVYIARGTYYYTIKVYEKASVDFTRAIQLSPRNSEIYYARAHSYASQNLREKAIKDFQTVLRLNPEHRHANGIPKLIDLLSKKLITRKRT